MGKRAHLVVHSGLAGSNRVANKQQKFDPFSGRLEGAQSLPRLYSHNGFNREGLAQREGFNLRLEVAVTLPQLL
jgi:hypothetical protein